MNLAATKAHDKNLIFCELTQHIAPEYVKEDLASRLQWANDASIYHLIPALVVLARDAADVQHCLRIAHQHQVPVCFRAGGTSLSGQAVTSGILIVISHSFRNIMVINDGQSVQAECGAVGAWVNAALATHNKRIGPDPASIQAAEIGGIVANNASGMCCGVHENSYRTVLNLDLILANGYRLNTSDPEANEALKKNHTHIYNGLCSLRDEIRADEILSRQIQLAFQTKNTVGYSLNAFLDAYDPCEILQKLIVGSEGTLAFICSAEFRCIDIAAYKSTAFLLFTDVEAAGSAVAPLADSGAAAIELLDAISLQRVADKLPQAISDQLQENKSVAALLVEYHDNSRDALTQSVNTAVTLCNSFSLLSTAEFSENSTTQAQLWAIRKGLFPSVGAVRNANTAVVIEDVTFPVSKLALGVRALRDLFSQYNYDDAVIFGHAKDGNLHFTLTPDFSKKEEINRYREFMTAMVHCVLEHDGHLKAEHGTGRNMAPYVYAQWGKTAVDIMRRIKKLLDPDNILNPGVLLSDDPQTHVKNLKIIPSVEENIDRCIECGFCEPVCPSRDATLSPRQRIVMLRHAANNPQHKKAVEEVWQHAGLDTCAADGMCATACPVKINTGDLVKAERQLHNGWLKKFIAKRIANNIPAVCLSTRLALKTCDLIGLKKLPFRQVPLPKAARSLPETWPRAQHDNLTIVYFPSCLSRSMHSHGIGAPEALHKLCKAAGIGI
ncbi:MAG: FAD-binding oxidoreductase, partial [Planctomycetes bacterium]|nr:FAD-binding oxidoreductase [Planctomycetota bacterium]